MNNIDLSELNLDDVGQWPMPAKMALIGILSCFVVFLGYWFLIKPNFEEYDILKSKHKNLRTIFETKQAQAANLQGYINQMAIMKERFSVMLKKLPAQHEMPGLLEDISKTGTSSGLTFELFAPKDEISHDFYTELPIDIIVRGSYQQLAVFLSRVGQLDRIVTLHDFTIAPLAKQQGEGAKENEGQLRMAITAKIYRYNTQ